MAFRQLNETESLNIKGGNNVEVDNNEQHIMSTSGGLNLVAAPDRPVKPSTVGNSNSRPNEKSLMSSMLDKINSSFSSMTQRIDPSDPFSLPTNHNTPNVKVNSDILIALESKIKAI